MTYLEDWNTEQRQAVAQWRRKHKALKAALDEIKVRGTSPKGELGVSVDAHGAVTDIRLTPQALRLGDDQLARLLLKTLQRAQSDAAARSESVAKPFIDDPDAAQSRAFIRDLLE